MALESSRASPVMRGVATDTHASIPQSLHDNIRSACQVPPLLLCTLHAPEPCGTSDLAGAPVPMLRGEG